ncbi:MAG TPA: hypothetical protein PLL78_06055 [Fimbriimonadaceae bacterium]|nr:hypothetical protein [Fimbriimonadaceae bacterium]HRJ96230.1 hypothetical protein [Fimbriimonadaceae bacterium]
MIEAVLVSLLGSDRTFGPVEEACRVLDERVTESSGLAASRLRPGTFLTHNDSGNPARLYRFDLKGKVLAEYLIEGAANIDWEGMATRREKQTDWVYLGDIGDNLQIRTEVQVYRFPEPVAGGQTRVDRLERYTLQYPNGPRNAEALSVDPKTGAIWIVTKTSQGPAEVYNGTLGKAGGKVRLKKAGELKVDTGGTDRQGGLLVTDGAFSPDGRYVVLRTYTGALEFDVPKDRTAWWRSKPRPAPVADHRGGEAICYSHDGASLMMTTEGSPFPVFRVPIRADRAPAKTS